MMNRFKDFFDISKKSFKECLSKLNKSYLVVLFVFFNTLFENSEIGFGLVSSTIGGIIDYFIGLIITCFVIQTLRSVVIYGNSGKKSIDNSINNFFSPLIGAMFYVYLIKMFANLLLVNFPKEVNLLVYILIQVALSSLFEQIYINGRTGLNAIVESANFVKNNLLTYGIYSLIFVLLEYIFGMYLKISMPLGTEKVIACLVVAIIDSFFCIFRGHLFKHLNKHSYRQRKFMRGY